MEEELLRFKNKKHNNTTLKIRKSYKKEIYKLLIATFITLIILILSKSSAYLNRNIKKYLFEDNIDFSKYMNKYSKYFSEFIPFEKIVTTKPVFNEKLKYDSINKYMDGAVLSVNDRYLVPNIGSGLVVYIGEKENYGKVVIIQQVDGVDVWYGNLDSVAIDLYDYVELGSLVGETKDDKLYIVLEKEGKYLRYEEYF